MTEALVDIPGLISLITLIIGILGTYFVANRRFLRYLSVAKEAMDIISTSIDQNKTDCDLGKEVREFFNTVHENTGLPLLTYNKPVSTE